MPPVFTVPEGITFEQAIALTQSLLSAIAQGSVSEAEVETTVAALVKSQTGARGFFVSYLTVEQAIADQPSAAILQALSTSADIVSDLLVKNLAMSAAMGVWHRRQSDEAQAQGSDRVRSRSLNLVQQLQLPALEGRAQQLLSAIDTGVGSDQAFLERQQYDPEQQQAIRQTLQQALTPS